MYVEELFFFFKQKTAYEMRISDWSSDVCSSDLNVENLKDEPAGQAPDATPAVRQALATPSSATERQPTQRSILAQIKRCWSLDPGAQRAEDVVVEVTVNLAPDGRVVGQPRGVDADRKRTRLNSSH